MESKKDAIQIGVQKYLAGELYAAKAIFLDYIENSQKNDLALADNNSAYYYLGLIYIETNDLKKATLYLLKAVEAEPENATYHYRLGFAYMQLTAIESAIQEFESTIALNSEHQRARFLLGKLYFQKGEMQRVLEIMSDVLARSEEFYEAFYYRSIAKEHLHDRAGALLDIKRTIEINEEFQDAYIQRARLLLANNDPIGAYNDCMSIYNNNCKSYTFLTFFLNVLKKLGKKEEYNKVLKEVELLYSLKN